MALRGTFRFEVTPDGDLSESPANVELLRDLWLDRSLVDGEDLGPGDPGDFDHGAWHVACHLVAAGGVRRSVDGRLLWLELSYDSHRDEYYAGVTVREDGIIRTGRLDSAAGLKMVEGSKLLGFVEGNSVGHISARGACDPADRFNGWRRQQFDKDVASDDDAGKVWEHWCTVRDIRPSHAIGSSVLRAYVTLVAALGDRFVPAVARGRRECGHSRQLCAMVRAGLTSEASATWDIAPDAIPLASEQLLLEARAADALVAVEQLSWDAAPRYYMFPRRIDRWSAAALVRADLASFPH